MLANAFHHPGTDRPGLRRPPRAGTRPPAGSTWWGRPPTPIDMAAQLDSGLADSAGQLLDLYYTLKDLSGELASRLEDYESNDGELDEIEQRLGPDLQAQTEIRATRWRMCWPLEKRPGRNWNGSSSPRSTTTGCRPKSAGCTAWRGRPPRS